ncbi:MAG: hypothetical protein ABEK03_11305 [Candidatus Bipolaricaulia bacterium]
MPSELRLRESTTDDDPFDVTISALGDTDFGEASTFSYRVTIDELIALDTLRAQLKRPTYGVTLGDLTARLSELIDVEGRGARVSVGTGPDSATGATVVTARDLDTDEVNFGVQAALQGGSWVASLAGRRQASPEESVTGISLLRLPLDAPALRVAGALSRNPASVDSAFLVRANTERLPFTFDGEILRAGPNFLGTVSDEARVELRPGVAFDDSTANAVFEWQRDGLASSATQTSSVETRIGANARLELEPLPVITAQVDYEIETSVAQVRLTDASVFKAEARASQTFGPLTIAAHALRKVTHDRTTNNRIARSQWRTEAELRLRSALLAGRLGMTTDVDLDTGTIKDRFLSASLRANWDFEASMSASASNATRASPASQPRSTGPLSACGLPPTARSCSMTTPPIASASTSGPDWTSRCRCRSSTSTARSRAAPLSTPTATARASPTRRACRICA